jgi:signal transduction histidine kinase
VGLAEIPTQALRGDFSMVRTLSAWLRRSFAQAGDACQTICTGLPSTPSLFVAVSLLQSTLLVGLTISVALDYSVLGGAPIELFGALAVFSTLYIGYAVTRGGGRSEVFTEAAELKPAPQTPHRMGDAEQLAKLKARVSHELRTPLNAVIGFSEMMHREVLGPVGNERYREYAAHIRKSAEHFQSAAEKTLAVTQLLASPPRYLRDQVSLTDAVDAALIASRSGAGGTELQTAVRTQPGLVIESNRDALLDAMHHLGGALQGLAMAADVSSAPLCSITSTAPAPGYIDLCFSLHQHGTTDYEQDSELMQGLEFTLLLARLGVEAAGGVLTVTTSATGTWQATVRMTAAAS